MSTFNKSVLWAVIALSLSATACKEQDRPESNATNIAKPPAHANPGMRAYVDPVSGEYTTPPPREAGQAETAPAASAAPAETTPPPEETLLPDGGARIKLDDRHKAHSESQ